MKGNGMSITAALQSMNVDDARALVDAEFEDVSDAFDEGVDLDKVWAAVAWLLRRCGAVSDPIQGASEMIGEDFGFGPIQFFPPDQVSAVATSLATVDDAALVAAFDPSALQEDDIYPSVWDRADEIGEWREWVVEGARQIIDLFVQASRDRLGVAVHFR
jgi:hypothetical protein